MNKKDTVRNWLKKANDNTHFTTDWLANTLSVGPKDVSNVLTQLVKNGVLEKTRISGTRKYQFTVVSNNVAAFYAKFPTGYRKANGKTAPPPSTELTIRPQGRKSPRPPFIMAIDQEIKDLKAKLARLNQIRKEFS